MEMEINAENFINRKAKQYFTDGCKQEELKDAFWQCYERNNHVKHLALRTALLMVA